MSRRVLGIIIICLTTAIAANGANDLLMLPAEKSDKAPYAILMDVVRVNHRLVAVGERGHILVLEDCACSSWIQADVPVSVTLTAVYFPSFENGWAVGHEGVVLHTTDGGKTWSKQLDGVAINEMVLGQIKEMLKVKTDILGNAESHLAEEDQEGLETEIENLNYFLSDAENAVKEGPTRPLMDVWFKNDREGIVIGSFGIILGTTDGGRTWEPLLNRIDNTVGSHYYGITRSGDDLFIAGEAGGLYRSEDFGKTWQRLSSPYEGSYFGIAGDPAGGSITAFGLRGNIYCSKDRGETWHSVHTGRESSISGGTYLSDGSIYLVAVDGSLLKSSDKGETFTPLSKNFPGSIGITQVNQDSIMIVGLRGATQIDVGLK